MMYIVLMEYKAKSIVPAPFSMIQVVVEIIAYSIKSCAKYRRYDMLRRSK